MANNNRFTGRKRLVPGRGILLAGPGLISFEITEHELVDRLGTPDDGMWESMGVFLYERFELTVHLGRGPALINWHASNTTTTLFGADPYAMREQELVEWLTDKEGTNPIVTAGTDQLPAKYRFRALSIELQISTGRQRTVTLFPERT